MSVDIILKDIEWDGVNKIRVPLEGGGTQDFSIGGGSANLQTKSKTYTPTTSQQTDTVSPDTGYDGLSSVNVTVNAMPSGTAGTPTATKGTVSNHSVSVTPSVTNTTGYITGGTKTGTSVSVSASELVSGSQTVAGNGTFDVTNLAQLIVDTPTMNLPSATSSTPTGTNKANILPSTSQQYLNIPAGLNETAQYYQLIGMELAPLNVTQNGTYNASTYDISGFNTVNVNVPTGGATLQTKSATYTPTESQQTDSILPDTGYDGMSQVDVTVNAISSSYVGSAITRRSSSDLTVSDATVTAPSGYYSASASTSVASGTVVPPASITEIGTVTVVTPTGHGSPRMRVTATSQAVPNVTQAGYISAGTSGQISVTLETNVTGKGTATFYPSTSDQSISASTYVSGVQTFKAVTTNNIIASNIKSGVTVEVGDADDSDRVLSVTGTYSGGTSTCDTKTMTNDDNQATSIQFTNLSGEPKWFFVRCTSQLSRSSSYSYYFVTDIRYNGTNHNGNYYRRSNGTYYNDTSHYSHTYSNGTLTVSSSANRGAAGGSFYNGNYELVYIY